MEQYAPLGSLHVPCDPRRCGRPGPVSNARQAVAVLPAPGRRTGRRRRLGRPLHHAGTERCRRLGPGCADGAMPPVSSVVLFVLAPISPSLRWNRPRASALLRKGRWVLSANLVDVGYLRLQYAVIGWLFGTAALGSYQRADSTQQIANDSAATVIGRVALPIFAESTGRPDLLRAGFRTGVRTTTAFTAPVMAIMAALSEPTARCRVRPAMDDRWPAPRGPGPRRHDVAVSRHGRERAVCGGSEPSRLPSGPREEGCRRDLPVHRCGVRASWSCGGADRVQYRPRY